MNTKETKEYHRKYYLLHKERSKKYSLSEKHKKWERGYSLKRKNTDIQFRLRRKLRTRLYMAIKQDVKKGKSILFLGCSISDFKKYLEKQFKKGMTWNNWTHNGWHIDHIKPLSSFDLTDNKQFLKAFHYKNTRPLWAKDNCLKSIKI